MKRILELLISTNLFQERSTLRQVELAFVAGSVLAASLLGPVFLIALTVAIDDIARVSASQSPIVLIMRDQLGPLIEGTLLVAITFAFFLPGC